MKIPSSSGRTGIRKRSPNKAPPVSGLLGSQARMATLWFSLRMIGISRPINVLLPTPPLPVIAITKLCCLGFGIWFSSASGVSPRDTMLSSRDSACRSPCRNWSSRESSTNGSALFRLVAQERHDLRHGRAGAENVRNPHLFELGNVFFRDDAADQNAHMIELGFAHQLQDTRHEAHV